MGWICLRFSRRRRSQGLKSPDCKRRLSLETIAMEVIQLLVIYVLIILSLVFESYGPS